MIQATEENIQSMKEFQYVMADFWCGRSARPLLMIKILSKNIQSLQNGS
jgi:hypothetical protein